eukprot:TRINITY_DN68668_c0_g1_i1.p1 TRINITY_DN68668_c0_g1~~TRINITY_DN68668_c0_g1_i1.p1  ORF type:complete len:647 (+),score=85.96 TRINITY_DN68668_c0_g1_i1:75-2015(+)
MLPRRTWRYALSAATCVVAVEASHSHLAEVKSSAVIKPFNASLIADVAPVGRHARRPHMRRETILGKDGTAPVDNVANVEPVEDPMDRDVVLLASPIGQCREKFGQSGITATGGACLKLGGFMKNASATEDQRGICILDWCVDGMYSMFPPGRCLHRVAVTLLQMTKLDCVEARGGLPADLKTSTADADLVNCTMEFCEDLGAFVMQPAGSCRQPLLMRHTMAADCRSMLGNVDPKLPGDKWTETCELDICRREVDVHLELDMRSARGASTETGADISFHVLHSWQPPISLCTSANLNETLSLDVKLESWPDSLRIEAKGRDDMGFREIRLVHRNKTLPVLSDIKVRGINNDQPLDTSSYWVGLGHWTPASNEYDVPQLTHLWRSNGNDMMCSFTSQSESDKPPDNSGPAKSKEVLATTSDECKSICEERSDCFGVNFELALKRCEILFQEPAYIISEPGKECFVYWVQPTLSTSVKPEEASYFQMLKAAGGSCLDHDPFAPDGEDVFLHDCTNSLTQQWHLDEGLIFSRSEPTRCLRFSGMQRPISIVDCSMPVDMTATQKAWFQTLPGEPPPDWRLHVKPNGSNWTFDGRRLMLNEVNRSTCFTAYQDSGQVLTEACDDNLIEQDWSFSVLPSWKKKLLGLLVD